MQKKHLHAWIIMLALVGMTGFITTADAALVGPSGYTNDFSVLPPAADWSTYAIPGANTLIATSADMDTQVGLLTASTVNLALPADAVNPPAATATGGAWCSTGFYLATRPTGDGASVIMCTLVNNLGSAAGGATLSFAFTKAGGLGDTGEEVPGFRCYYSLTGAAGSWVGIPAFSSANPGVLTVTLTSLNWAAGAPLYVLWADDNGANVSPDDSMQIDNFSAVGISAAQVPVAITGQPQNQTVAEAAPASFTVVATGNPPPTYQWFTNSIAVIGATNSTYTIPSTPYSFNNLLIYVIAANTVSNVNYSVPSSVATLTVNPDQVPPTVTRLIPPAGATVNNLTSIEVLFSEAVNGVDASDLLVDGVPASIVTPAGSGQFLFEFSQPPTGAVTFAWAAGHGITDQAAAANNFAGGSWTNILDPSYSPTTFLINEILASNNKGLRDEDGDDSDWIEILNPSATAGNIGGCYLTDDPFNLTKWQFPYRVLDPGAYLLVFASGKNRTNIMAGTIYTNLHANFNLKAGGSYLAMVDPSGTNVISAFAPTYPAQTVNVSYGRDQHDSTLVGFFTTPTPRGPNSTEGAGFAPAVSFSRDSGNFVSNFNLALSTPSSNAVIFYAFGTNLPGSNVLSTIYTNGSPIPVTTTVAIRARAFEPGKLPGPVTTKFFIQLANASSVLNATSGLPIVVLHNYGQGTPPTSKGDQYVFVEVFDTEYGYSSLTNTPTLTARGDFHARGSSTVGLAKQSFFLEIRDEFDQGRNVPLLGLPDESDWVLYAPNGFEPVLMHNPLAHSIYRDQGRYGSRTRFCEVYVKDDSGAPGPLTSADYNGIYVLEEKVKRDQNRVDLARLDQEDATYPAITGGYLMSIDRTAAGEAIVAINFTNAATGATWFPDGGATINFVSPNGFVMTNALRAPQTNYIAHYINQFSKDLYGPNWNNPATTNHYSNYIDVDNWIDLHIHEVVTFNVDGMRLSGYFFKDRNKKLGYGPTWDYDRTQGSADNRDFNPRVWRSTVGTDYGTPFFAPETTPPGPRVPWWGKLLTDPDFWQAWIDRYQHLRTPGEALSTNSIFAHIDQFLGALRDAQPREQTRWAGVTLGTGNTSGTVPRNGPVSYGSSGWTNVFSGNYQGEVQWQKNWYSNRLEFIDTNFLAPPAFGLTPGALGGPSSLTVTPAVGLGDKPSSTQLILTLDGTDPRLPGGGIATGPNVLSNTGPITIAVTNAVRVFARSRNPAHVNLTGIGPVSGILANPPISSPWSGPQTGTYYFSNATPPLRITEIMYNPPNAPAGNTNDADNFEYLEFKNISGTPLDVTGFRLRSGVQFDFPSLVLGAGQSCLVVADIGAFSSRYNTNGLIIAGSYTNDPGKNRLGNGGDHIKLEGRLQEPILDFDYSDTWYPTTDGNGFSLQIVNENLPTSAWGLKSSWRPSGQVNGTPGTADPGAVNVSAIYINEILSHEDPLDPLQNDAIELYNPNGTSVDLSGWFLTDNFSNPKKYRIPNGTSVGANGYIVFYATNSFGNAFQLSSKGEEVYVFSGDANTNLSGYVHGFTFGAQAIGVTFGRYVTSVGQEYFPAQVTPSLGSTNAGPKVGPIVISEIHYHPPDIGTVEGPRNDEKNEYVELENITGVAQPLFDPNFPTNTWHLRNGIDFAFPTNVMIPAGGHVVVVSFDPADPISTSRFMAANHVAPGAVLFGPFQGHLDNASDGIELARPDVPEPPTALDANAVYYILVDKVGYSGQPPWPSPADGFGYSIQRLNPTGYGNDPANWIAAPVSAGAARVSGLPPIITTQPASRSAPVGGNASFSVSVQGSGPFTYAWFFNGVSITNNPSAATATLTLTNVQGYQLGQYQVQVLNSAGVVASSNANLSILQITQQPQGQTVRLGDLTSPSTANVNFSVIASSANPITYQWRFNGGNIPGATGPALILTNVVPSQTGDYSVVASDAFGSVTSVVARLSVFSNSGWRFLSVTGTMGATAAALSTNVLMYMSAAGEAYVDDVSLVPLSGTYAGSNILQNSSFESPLGTLTTNWIVPAAMTNSVITNTFAHSGSSSLHVVATNGGSQFNAIRQFLPLVSINTTSTLTFWYHTLPGTTNVLNVRTFPGSALSTNINLQTLDQTPTIASQPNSVVLPVTGSASFAVTAFGSEPLAYQWFKDGLALADGGKVAGAATAGLTISGVSAAEIGNYSVKVSNALGFTNSALAALIVTGAPPQITLQPQSQSVPCNGNVTFTVGAIGSPPLAYQWLSNQVVILNATNTSLTLTNVGLSASAAYSVAVSNPAGSTNSLNANLVVTDPVASLTIQRSDTNVVVSWPASCTTYQLQEAAILDPAAWSPSSAQAQQVGALWTATIPITNTNRFYRLHN